MVQVPMRTLLMVLILRGCWSVSRGNLSWRAVAWSVKLAAACELISAGRKEALPKCLI